jgi:hypothetical protein
MGESNMRNEVFNWFDYIDFCFEPLDFLKLFFLFLHFIFGLKINLEIIYESISDVGQFCKGVLIDFLIYHMTQSSKIPQFC